MLQQHRPNVTWEWKFNPAVMLAIVVAATSMIAGFVRADYRITDNADDIADQAAADVKHEAKHDQMEAAIQLLTTNNAVLTQWQQDQERRITKLED